MCNFKHSILIISEINRSPSIHKRNLTDRKRDVTPCVITP